MTKTQQSLTVLIDNNNKNTSESRYSEYENKLFDLYTELGIEFVSLLSDKDNNKDRLIVIDREMDRIKNSLSYKCIVWVS